MSDTQHMLPTLDEATTYEIRIQGHLPERWVEWLGAVAIELEADGVTRLNSTAIDQAALHGLLRRVRDLGLPVVSVNRVALSHTHLKQEHEHE